MKCPCKQNCPNRSATCHENCDEWLEYEQSRNEYYQKRHREQVAGHFFSTKDFVRYANGKKISSKRYIRRDSDD